MVQRWFAPKTVLGWATCAWYLFLLSPTTSVLLHLQQQGQSYICGVLKSEMMVSQNGVSFSRGLSGEPVVCLSLSF